MARNTQDVVADRGDKRLIKLVYDSWTPRPHFIAVQYQPRKDANPEELLETFTVVSKFLLVNSQFNSENILSFHRGKWYQQYTGHWHAHLLVPYNAYLQSATEKIEPSRNRQWGNSQTVTEGMQKWDAKRRKEYQNYQKDCIQKVSDVQTSVESVPLSALNIISTRFKLVWSYQEPRIGVIASDPQHTNLNSLYEFLSSVSINAEALLSSKDSSFKNFGCHLCLYVSGRSDIKVTCRPGTVFTQNGQSPEDSNLVGYIQMEEVQYAQWLPRNLRKTWLEQFTSVNHFVST